MFLLRFFYILTGTVLMGCFMFLMYIFICDAGIINVIIISHLRIINVIHKVPKC